MDSRLILLFSIVTFVSAFHFPTASPKKACNCRKLSECLAELKSIHGKGRGRRELINYLDKINCGYDKQTPLVCCPSKNSQSQQSTQKLRCASLKVKSKAPKNHDQCGKVLTDAWTGQGNRTKFGEHPWSALLEYTTPQKGKQHLCGGVLISDQHILTSARCVTSRDNKLTSIILNEYDTNSNPDCIDIGEKEPWCWDPVKRYDIEYSVIPAEANDEICHQGFANEGSKLHDIAIIKLKQKVRMTPVCLPTKQEPVKSYIVAGWGRSFVPGNKGFNWKMASKLTEYKNSECNIPRLQHVYDKNKHICAGTKVDVDDDPCIFDNGGPLMSNERQRGTVVKGVASIQTACPSRGSKNIANIFTNIHNYIDWIAHQME